MYIHIQSYIHTLTSGGYKSCGVGSVVSFVSSSAYRAPSVFCELLVFEVESIRLVGFVVIYGGFWELMGVCGDLYWWFL